MVRFTTTVVQEFLKRQTTDGTRLYPEVVQAIYCLLYTSTTQIVAQVASNQYGGQSFSLGHLAPFVQVSREKITKEVLAERDELNLNYSDEQVKQIAERRLKDEINRGIQTIQYQLITLMTCNGQAPFVTMFMYLDEVPEGQTRDDLATLIEEVLKQRIQGVKNEKGVWITPAFPKIIYVLDEDNVTPDSKYWALTELAAKCTAKRMVPDYISAKVMKEMKQGCVYPCMGCRSFLTVEDSQRNADGTHKFYGRFNQMCIRDRAYTRSKPGTGEQKDKTKFATGCSCYKVVM